MEKQQPIRKRHIAVVALLAVLLGIAGGYGRVRYAESNMRPFYEHKVENGVRVLMTRLSQLRTVETSCGPDPKDGARNWNVLINATAGPLAEYIGADYDLDGIVDLFILSLKWPGKDQDFTRFEYLQASSPDDPARLGSVLLELGDQPEPEKRWLYEDTNLDGRIDRRARFDGKTLLSVEILYANEWLDVQPCSFDTDGPFTVHTGDRTFTWNSGEWAPVSGGEGQS